MKKAADIHTNVWMRARRDSRGTLALYSSPEGGTLWVLGCVGECTEGLRPHNRAI